LVVKEKTMGNFMGLDMAQEMQDLIIWDQFFEKYPIKLFVELGTGHGGFSAFLGLHCQQRGIEFHTFDNFLSIPMDAEPIAGLIRDKILKFHFVDIFSAEGQAQLVPLLWQGKKPVAIFFDDGDKPREWKLMAPLTSPGDFCIVHDWETEFFPENIGDVKVQPILEEMCAKRGPGWKAKWFKRI
jgi:cephalosporin hydroxylase